MKALKKSIPTLGRRSMFGGFARGHANTSQLEESPDVSIERKCEMILAEMERVKSWEHRHIESSVLHKVPQVFVTIELHKELEAELDRLLMEQLIQEEQKVHATSSQAELVVYESIEETMPDDDFCTACNTLPCQWKPLCDAAVLTRRKKDLYRELAIVQKHQGKVIRSVVARSILNGGNNIFIPADLIKELSTEIKEIESSIKLSLIDKELHHAYSSTSEAVTVRSIHGFDTTVQRDNAIHALEFEHNRHIATSVAAETIEGILDWILEGWYFGERDSDKHLNNTTLVEMPSFEQRGSLNNKAIEIQLSSNLDTLRAANANRDTNEDLKNIENTMCYGIFLLTFMYFRALHLVRHEKETWSGVHDAVTMAKRAPLSAERMKMMEEERNAASRKARLDYAMEKARRGEEKKRLRLEKERLEKARILQWDNKQKQTAQRLALCLQRVYRGHIGRKVARVQCLQQDRIRSANVLMNACATAIARVWRGYCGRQDADYLRREMVEFLFAIREEEARDEEEELLVKRKWF